MAGISQIELENLRHQIGDEQLCSAKAGIYADAATNSELKRFFSECQKDAQSNVEKLKQFLH